MSSQFSCQFSKLETLIQTNFSQSINLTKYMDSLNDKVNKLTQIVTEDSNVDQNAARQFGINLNCQYVSI